MAKNKYIEQSLEAWHPILYQEIKKEDELLEAQRQFEEEAKELESSLEHKYMVGLEYCGWLPETTLQEKRLKKQVQACYPYCCFNHQAGLPKRKYRDQETNEEREGEPVELYEYEHRMVKNYETHAYYAQNKIRGAGATEILAVRHMAYKYAVVNRIEGRKYLLAAGVNRSVAVGVFRRIVVLLKPFPFIYKIIPNSLNPTVLLFRGGGEAKALSAHPDAARGEENVGDVLLDEASAWELVDDEPVLKAYEPFVAKSGAHIGVFGTPKGQRGFYWTKIFDPELPRTKYYKHLVTLQEVKNVPIPIIDVAEAERLRLEDPDLYAQEFGNQFILPSLSIFGSEFPVGEHRAEF